MQFQLNPIPNPFNNSINSYEFNINFIRKSLIRGKFLNYDIKELYNRKFKKNFHPRKSIEPCNTCDKKLEGIFETRNNNDVFYIDQTYNDDLNSDMITYDYFKNVLRGLKLRFRCVAGGCAEIIISRDSHTICKTNIQNLLSFSEDEFNEFKRNILGMSDSPNSTNSQNNSNSQNSTNPQNNSNPQNSTNPQTGQEIANELKKKELEMRNLNKLSKESENEFKFEFTE